VESLKRKIAVNLLGESNAILLYYKLFHRDRIVKNHKTPKKFFGSAKNRWLQSQPDKELTWGIKLTGDSFIDKVDIHGNILEIGPGWGRLLTSIMNKGEKFDSYMGLDISSSNVDYLQKKFRHPNIEFVYGDAENFKFDRKFDVIFSSLTFKHIYPTFENALANLKQYLDGTIYFDLIEGNLAFLEKDDAYIKLYTKKEVIEILNRCNLRLERFDKVVHAPSFTRMLVIAYK